MNIKPNIGILNALIRITCGLSILAWSTAKMVKYPWRDSYLFMAFLGAMKVGEGIVRYCPVTAFFEKGMLQGIANNEKSQAIQSEQQPFENNSNSPFNTEI